MAAHAPPGADLDVVIQASRLRKDYGHVRAIAGLDLTVHEGEVFGFLGPNGAGKTTFTKCMLGFIRPSAGRIELFGREVQGRDRTALTRVGLVPDQFGFYPNLTGWAHLDFYARLYGIGRRDREQRMDELTKLVRLENRIHERVRTYSHGMRQRLVIAHALLNDPDLIVFDEPTTGLDPKGAYEVRELLKRLAASGVTTFLSSHILHEVEEICSQVAIMNRGVLLKQASVSELRQEFAQAAGEQVEVQLDALDTNVLDAVAELRGVLGVETTAERTAFCAVLETPDLVPDVVRAVVESGGRVRGVRERHVSLEELFLHYTDDGESPGSASKPSAPAPGSGTSTGWQAVDA